LIEGGNTHEQGQTTLVTTAITRSESPNSYSNPSSLAASEGPDKERSVWAT